MVDADDVARVAAGLASGEVQVPAVRRTDTREGRSARRRRGMLVVAVAVVVLTLIGLLSSVLVQPLGTAEAARHQLHLLRPALTWG